MKNIFWRTGRVSLAAIALAALLACGSKVTNPVSGQSERSSMSEAAEVQEGAKAHQEVLKEYTPLNNPRLQAYVNDVGQRLAAQSHRAQLKWTFTVLDSPEINAFALPGGFIYITRGIMAYLDSEADLAGVLGHEIGHVTARHGAQRATRAQNAQVGAVLGGILGAVLDAKGGGGVGQQIGQASQAAAAGYVAKYGREQELQADSLGAEYLARVNHDPRNMIDVIRVLKDQERFAQDVARAEGRQAPEGNSWLASHPSNDQRLSQITQIAAKYPTNKNYADEGRNRYLQMIDGMPFGESPEQGLTRGSNFYHGGMNFALTAPAGWKIINSADQVNIISPQRDAGLSLQVVPAQAGKTHDEVIRNYIKPVSGNVERLNFNGLPATHFTGVVNTQQGRQNAEITVVTSAAGANFLMIHEAKDAATLNARRAELRQAAQSFRAMTPPDKIAAQPWLLRTVGVPRGGLPELARSLPMQTLPEQQLRLINGIYSGGDIRPGTLAKTVSIR